MILLSPSWNYSSISRKQRERPCTIFSFWTCKNCPSGLQYFQDIRAPKRGAVLNGTHTIKKLFAQLQHTVYRNDAAFFVLREQARFPQV